MHVALMGTICSGKKIFANILKDEYGFIVIDLSAIFCCDSSIEPMEWIKEHNPHFEAAIEAISVQKEADLHDCLTPNEQQRIDSDAYSPIISKNTHRVTDSETSEETISIAKKFDFSGKEEKEDQKEDQKEEEESKELTLITPEENKESIKALFPKKFPKDYYLDEESQIRVEQITTKVVRIIKDYRKLDFVIYPVVDLSLWDSLLLTCYHLDSPLKMRYNSFKEKYGEDIELMDFIELEDDIVFKSKYQTWKMDKYQERIKNHYVTDGTQEDLKRKIIEFNPVNEEMIRPKWPTYFMRLAHIVSSRSNCIKKSVGAIIVNENQQIVATGYNGTPFGFENCYEGGCSRCNDFNNKQGENLDLCVCIHAEENAILMASRVQTDGCSLYVTLHPCALCAKFIIQSGIKKIYYYEDYNSKISRSILSKMKIPVTKIDPYH
ncbi:unnamed protein product [Moneuplotes crassus]|uniref:dCMP deaminase n=1 Tax=Euplotes crassus TaxID=5936 RepID=A0AAD1UIV7_EUPCR|nr:unnamed protein product [Moneuplotes crassus]